MTAEEMIERLLEIVNSQEELSVKDLADIVNSISIEDRVAGKDALTIFYSGESEILINELVDKADDNVRILRRSDAYAEYCKFCVACSLQFIIDRYAAKMF